MRNPHPVPAWKRAVSGALVLLTLQMSVGPALAAGLSPLLQGQQTPPQQERMLIGVLELDANGVEESEARAIAERLRLYLGRQGIFQVIERNSMNAIMDELGFQLSGACDTDECVVQIGKILGARKMVAGSVSKVGTLYSLQVRLVDIETSRIEDQQFSDVNGIEAVLTDATQAVSRDLANTVRAAQGQAVQQPTTPPVTTPPVTQEDPPVTQPSQAEANKPTPGEEEQGQPRKKSKLWLWLLLIAGAGGGAAAAMGGSPGDTGPDPISSPPSRPVPPQG